MAAPMIGDHHKARTIADDAVNAAVDVVMRHPTVSLFRFANGHTLDLAAAVRAHDPARAVVADQDRTENCRRGRWRNTINGTYVQENARL